VTSRCGHRPSAGIRGNALWTHSLYTSPRSEDGRFLENHFDSIGRDAIQVGHATRIAVERKYRRPDRLPGRGGGRGTLRHGRWESTRRATWIIPSTCAIASRKSNGKCIDLDGIPRRCGSRKQLCQPAARGGLSLRSLRHRDEQHRSQYALAEHRDCAPTKSTASSSAPYILIGSGTRADNVFRRVTWPAATRARISSVHL